METHLILHVCSENTAEGTAALMHSQAISEGLVDLGWEIEKSWYQRSPGKRSRQWLILQRRHIQGARRSQAVYARWHIFDTPLYLWCWTRRKPLVLEVNGKVDDIWITHPLLRSLSLPLGILSAVQLTAASHVIAVSSGIEKWVQKRSVRARTSWVRNGAPTTLAEQAQCAAVPPFAVFVGNLAHWQGIEVALAAVQGSDWPTGLILHVVGDGSRRALVEEAAEDPQVQYHGPLPQPSARALMAQATVSLCPLMTSFPRNHICGIPFKVLESMMLGVPVAASRIGHYESVVRQAPGCVTYVEDSPEGLARAVRQVVAGSSVDTRDALRRYAVATLGWDEACRHADWILRSLHLSPPTQEESIRS